MSYHILGCFLIILYLFTEKETNYLCLILSGMTFILPIILLMYLFSLTCNLHIQRTHLVRGKMEVTQLLLPVPMELHQLLPTSSLKGMYSDPYAPRNI